MVEAMNNIAPEINPCRRLVSITFHYSDPEDSFSGLKNTLEAASFTEDEKVSELADNHLFELKQVISDMEDIQGPEPDYEELETQHATTSALNAGQSIFDDVDK